MAKKPWFGAILTLLLAQGSLAHADRFYHSVNDTNPATQAPAPFVNPRSGYHSVDQNTLTQADATTPPANTQNPANAQPTPPSLLNAPANPNNQSPTFTSVPANPVMNIATNSNGTIWQEIQGQLGPVENNALVQRELRAFLSRPKELNLILQNSAPYIYYVYQQTKKRNMPAMFALLPLLESGYNPYSYSRTGASGLWQLMPGTAAGYGLDIDWWYDSRRDIIISTNASLNFLSEMHKSLNDWDLTAAAYDAGDGAVENAMAYNRRARRATDFWSLPLPQETRDYVPQLLALAAIVKNPERYGVTLPAIPNKPFFVAFKMNEQMSLDEIAKLSAVALPVVQRLNPGIRRLSTSPSGEYTLLIPADNAAIFQHNLAQVAGRRHYSWQYHEVHTGETIEAIAKNYHTNMQLIAQVNNLTNSPVQPGQGLLVPIWLNRTFKNPVVAAIDPMDLTFDDKGILTAQRELTAKSPVLMSLPSATPPPAAVLADNETTSTDGLPVNIPSDASGSESNQPIMTSAPPQAPSVTTPQAPAAPIITADESLKSVMAKLYGKD